MAAGAALHLAGADLFQPAFAEQSPAAAIPDTSMQQAPTGNSYYRSISESMSVVASHGSGSGTMSSPQSYYRSVSESMSVTTMQGKAPNSYTRSMSEQASLTTGMPSSAPAGPQVRAAPAPYSASSNQRIDERTSFRNLAGGKTDSAYRNTAGTSVYSDSMSVSYELSGSDAGIIIQDTASVDGGESESGDNSSSALLRQLDAVNDYMLMQKSIENAALANLSTSAVILLGTVAVVVARQPAVSGGRLKERIRAVFLLKHATVDVVPLTSNASTVRVMLFVVVIFSIPSLAVSIAPSSAQEYGLGKSVVEILQASHMDSDRIVLADITEESRKLDDIWSGEISDGHHVRVTFEEDLNSSRDITIYARTVSGEPRIQVYEKDGEEIIAEFTHLVSNENNKVFLTNLQGSQDTFDLRVIGGSVEFDHIVDPWPIPTYVGAGTADSGTGGGVTPTLPAGLQNDDILLLFVETNNQAVTVDTPNGGTWTEVADSPQGTTGTRLTVFWSRYNGLQGNPSLSDSGNHNLAIIHAFRGVITTGDPWDVTNGNVEATADTSLSAMGDTTTVANTLVVVAAALDDDAGDFGATWTNANLANITVRSNDGTASGNDGRLGVITGEKAAAGAYGATTNTLTSSRTKGMMTIALKPPAPVAPTLSISQPDGSGDTVTRGDPYSITYTLSDLDDVTAAAFYFDTNNSGLDGTAISGACATAAEGMSVTCQWDTTNMATGSYFVYGIANDGTNPAVSAYSPGQITINAVNNLRNLSEQLAAADAVARLAVQAVTITEQMAVAASIQTESPNGGSKSITEQAGISESINPAQVLSRSMAEQMAAADSIVGARSSSTSITEQAGISDSIEFDHIVDPIPTYVGAGTFAESDGPDITPTLPSGVQTDDILLLFVETMAQAVTVSNPNGGTWTEVADSPQSFDGATNAEDTRLTVFWSRHDGSQGDPTIAGSGNHNLAIILAFRGVITTGDPWDVTGGNNEGNDNSLSATGDTTTVANTLVVVAAALADDNADFGATWTNADLASVTEQVNISTTLGNDGRLGIVTGEKATAGPYAATTNTLTNPAEKGMMTIALRSPASPTLSISQPDGTGDTVTWGDPYNITYTLSDDDDVTTAAFYFDTNNSGLDGTAISGACATAAEGTGVTCQLDTTGMIPGSYYVYGIANDGTNPAVSAYSPGQITINPLVNPRSATEQAGLTDSIVPAQVLSRSMAEQMAAADSIVGIRSFSGSTADQAAISDSIQADAVTNAQVSMTEQMGLQDRIYRTLNGYSAGTVYRSDTGDFGLDSVKYRQWDPTANIWSYEVELPDTGSEIRDARIAFSPVNEMRVVVSHSVDGTLNLFRCDAVCIDESSWTLVAEDFADTGTPSASRPFRYFDIGFEQLSGELLLVYDRTETQFNDLYYRTYDGSTLAAESAHNYFGPINLLDTEVIPFIRIASKPNSDEMAVVMQDFTRQDAYAVIFDAATGTPSTTNQVTLTSSMGTTSIEGESVGIAYEPGNGNAVAFSSNGLDSMAFATWNGTSWSSVSTVDPNSGASSHIKFMSVKASPSATNDAIMVCQVDDQSDLTCAEMENGSLGSFTVIDSDINSMTTRPFDFVWNQGGSSATLAWGTSADVVNWAVWNGSSWGSSSTTSMTGTHQWIVADEAPSTVETTKAVFLAMNSAFDIGSLGIVGSSLTLLGDATHTTETTGTTFEGMHIGWHFAGIRQPFRLLADQLALTETLAINVIKPRSEAMALTETITAVRAVSKVVAENLAVTETISMVVVKPLSESAALTDTITVTRAIPRSMTEQLGMADAIARSFTGSRSASEQLGVTESVTKTVTVALNEQLGLVDSIIRFFTIERSISDQLGMTDAIAMAVSKPLVEQAVLTESTARLVVQTRTVSEQMTFTDTISVEASKPLAEQLGVTDTIARSIISERTLSEQLAATDSVTKTVTYVLTENLGLAESADRAITVSRLMTEQLGMTESTAKAASITLSEQLGVFDAMARSIVTNRILLEQLVVTEALAASVSKPLAEQLAMTEQLARSIISARAMTEQLAATEAVSVTVSKGLAEQLGMSDSIQRSIVTVRTLTEQLGVTETIAKAVSIAVSEQMVLTETAARSTFQSVFFTEQLAVSDTLAKSVSRTLSEQMIITENTARTIVLTRTMSEQLVMSDAVSKNFAAELSEQMTLTESAARSVVQSRFMSEELALQDAIAKAASMAVAEQLTMTETAARSVVQSRSMQEQLVLSDSIAVAMVKPLSESLDMTDAIARSVVQSVSLTEQMATQDTVTISNVKEISEQLILTDALARSATVSRPATEQLGATDAISVAVSRSTADQLALTDEVARSVVQSRSMSEQLAATDSVTVVVTKQLIEQLVTTDTLTRMVVQSRSISEQMGLSETAAAQVTSRAISESLSVADSVSMTVSRSMSEQLNVAESISISAPKSMIESLAVADSVTIGISRSMTEQMGMTDAAVSAISAVEISEGMTVSDAVSITVSRAASDQLGVTESIVVAIAKSIADSMAMSDAIVPTAPGSASESLSITESIVARPVKPLSDQLGVTDSIAIAVAMSLVDQLAMTDSAIAVAAGEAFVTDQLGAAESISIRVTKLMTENLALSEAIMTAGSTSMVESMAVTDAISRSLVTARTVSESLSVQDSAAVINVILVFVADTLELDEAFTDISIVFNLILVPEGLVLAQGFATNVEGMFDQADNEGIVIGADVTLVLESATTMTEALALQDQIIASQAPARGFSDSLAISDDIIATSGVTVFINDSFSMTSNTDFMVEPAPTTAPGSPLPPISVLVVTDKENVDQIPGVSVPGTYSYNGNVTELAEQLMPLPHYINATVSRPDLPAMTMVLPTYHISITPSSEIPGEDVLMTVMAAEIPADTPVLVPVSMESTPGMETDIPWINVEFTPAVNTTNFALIVSVIEEPPTGAQDPEADLKPIYIDVRWIGDFPGAEDPSVEEYYANPPRFIFAVPEEWAMEQDTQRNEDGVPMVSLGLLDEDTGVWETIEDIDMPAGLEDGEYVYVAHLNHFSTYVITANQATTPGGGTGGSGGGSSGGIPPIETDPEPESPPVIVEELAGRKFVANLIDSFDITSGPAAYKTLEVLPDLDVSIRVVDVVHEGGIMPSAKALLDVYVENQGDVMQEFTLNFWYDDQTGKRVFEQSQHVEIGQHDSKTIRVEIPFTSPGTYSVTTEAKSVPEDRLLATTDLQVTVPWLLLYFYVLIVVAVAIMAGSVIALLLFLSKGGSLIVLGVFATGAAVLLARKRRLHVRVARKEAGVANDDYDLLVNVTLADGIENKLGSGNLTAIFEIVNRSKHMQQIVLAYYLTDVTGVRLPESALRLRIDKHRTDLHSAKVKLPSPAGYVLQVEARTLRGRMLASDRFNVRSWYGEA